MNRADASFTSMGSRATVRLESDRLGHSELERLAAAVGERFEAVERALSRFDPDSELSALNGDPRAAVPASPLLRQLILAARSAGSRSRGLVDATLLGELESAGYTASRRGIAPASLEAALSAAPARRSARGRPERAWARVGVDQDGRVVRPAGLRLDSGGLAKGLAADLAAAELPAGVRHAVNCGGDLVLGTPPDRPWEVAVSGARSGEEVHRLHLRSGAVATSGIHARLWQRPDGSYAHHVLDPATGEPAWTGLVAATAVGASATEAEVLAKSALLSGPSGARALLRRRGGVLQHDDGRVEVIAGLPVARLPVAAPRLAA